MTNKAFHGIGLQSVTEIVENYDGQMEKEVEKDEVIIRVILSNEHK